MYWYLYHEKFGQLDYHSHGLHLAKQIKKFCTILGNIIGLRSVAMAYNIDYKITRVLQSIMYEKQGCLVAFNARVDGHVVIEKALEQTTQPSNIMRATSLPNQVHGQLWITQVKSAETQLGRKHWPNSRSTR